MIFPLFSYTFNLLKKLTFFVIKDWHGLFHNNILGMIQLFIACNQHKPDPFILSVQECKHDYFYPGQACPLLFASHITRFINYAACFLDSIQFLMFLESKYVTVHILF